VHAGEADLGAHDPEPRSGAGERRRMLVEAQTQADAVQGGVQFDLLDLAGRDPHVLESGLSGLDARAVGKIDPYLGAAAGHFAIAHPSAYHQCYQGNHPDEREGPHARDSWGGQGVHGWHGLGETFAGLGQRTRGSNACVASTVSTTAAANATIPLRACTDEISPNCTSPVRKAARKTSSIDQRPTKSRTAKVRVSRRESRGPPFLTLSSSQPRPASLTAGMQILAVNTMAAIAQRPWRHSSTVPEKIVSLRLYPEVSVLNTGSRLAGTSITAAATASAAAVELLLNLTGERRRFMALQRSCLGQGPRHPIRGRSCAARARGRLPSRSSTRSRARS